MTDRRSFLKASLGGTLLLGTVAVGAGLSGCDSRPAGDVHSINRGEEPGYRFRFLTGTDLLMLQVLVPAIIGPALQRHPERLTEATHETIRGIDSGIVRFSQGSQNEIRQLFDLLTFAPSRVAVARIWSWESASRADADAFLERWRSSGVGLFNKGYIALSKITNVAFYGTPEYRNTASYPGPPRWAMDALPQFPPQTT